MEFKPFGHKQNIVSFIRSLLIYEGAMTIVNERKLLCELGTGVAVGTVLYSCSRDVGRYIMFTLTSSTRATYRKEKSSQP